MTSGDIILREGKEKKVTTPLCINYHSYVNIYMHTFLSAIVEPFQQFHKIK